MALKDVLLTRWDKQIGANLLDNYVLERERRKAGYLAVSFLPSYAEDFSRFVPMNALGYDEQTLIGIDSVLVSLLYRIECPKLDPPIRVVSSVFKLRFLSTEGNPGVLIAGGKDGCLSQRDLLYRPTCREASLPVVFSTASQPYLIDAAMDMDMAIGLAADDQMATTASLPYLETFAGFPLEYSLLPDFSSAMQEHLLASFREGAALPVLYSPDGIVEDVNAVEDGFRRVSFRTFTGVQVTVPLPEWVVLEEERTEKGVYVPSSTPFARLPVRTFEDFDELCRSLNMRSLDWLRTAVFDAAITRRKVVLRERNQDTRTYNHRGVFLKTVPIELVAPVHYSKGRTLINLSAFLGRAFPARVRQMRATDPFSSHIFVVPLEEAFPRGEHLVWQDQEGRQVFDLSTVTRSGGWVLEARGEGGSDVRSAAALDEGRLRMGSHASSHRGEGA